MKRILILIHLTLFSLITYSQDDAHKFTILKQVKTTPVKSQGKSGTCWAFASTSFVETELLRLGIDEIDISEMFTVRHKLLPMAEKYIKYHGKSNFGDGGQAHDLLDAISKYGMVTEEAYTGKNIGLDTHNHGEMTVVLQGMLDAILKKKSGKLTSKWKDAIESVLNTYLGIPPEKFSYNGKVCTPKSFVEEIVTEPEKEKIITQKMRQEAFENFDVTDDHLMHLVGVAENQKGTKFYYTKNSWGTKNKKYDGYWYMSESYIRLKTVAIMVHVDSIPKKIRKKLDV